MRRRIAADGTRYPALRISGWVDPLERSISRLMADAGTGDAAAAGELFSALYAELHRLAQRQLKRSPGRALLGTTTLLHEAYLEMSARENVFPDRGHFMAYASRVMRGLVIDDARKQSSDKRGGQFVLASLDSNADVAAPPATPDELEDMGEALDRLAAVEPALAEVVDLKFFCGFSFVEIAALRGISERTVKRHWEKARIYLHRYLRGPWRD